MTDAFAHVHGHRLTSCKLTVPYTGAWRAELDFAESPELQGRVTITLGTRQLSGTISKNGTFALQRKTTVVGGAAAWPHEIDPKNYHNDAGVKARTVADDAARLVGEQLGSFVPQVEKVGSDYVRQRGTAERALTDVIGDTPWWVDDAGVTQVGPRAAVTTPASAYEVLAYDPRDRVVTLAVDDPGAVVIGSVLVERLDAPATVRELELNVTKDGVRVTAYCGTTLADAVTALMRATGRNKLFGKYRYRVVRMAGERVELQAVRALAGLPDVLPVSMWPGVAGAHAELAPGAIVLVEFIEGDRAQPIVTSFAGVDGAGHVPESLTLCGSLQRVARQGDLVQSGGPGCSIILTGAGAPPNNAVVAGIPYLCSFSAIPTDVGPLAKPLYGAISTGSPKVRA